MAPASQPGLEVLRGKAAYPVTAVVANKHVMACALALHVWVWPNSSPKMGWPHLLPLQGAAQGVGAVAWMKQAASWQLAMEGHRAGLECWSCLID